MELFAQRLKTLRIEKQVTQRAIANYLDITDTAYGFYEQGKNYPNMDILIKLADYFEVSLDYLVGRSEERK
ncbi:DNA-binding XRE family transcriptional regulator [Hydrogenispora ethanolica]|uniref:DNA-binding XRE family transcriptional regulator n=1 Tax=Hydrogenispora ethanolica TaxID=1082276 RepID=A0A4R1QMK0_HYDET|nr:helix-turn-helix transcriptional regulator [Hydrogenispora ethanolica]TCL54958.1 DNA-binding XRE family transcriptional regulator [Hydrogenispora ethanolica]